MDTRDGTLYMQREDAPETSQDYLVQVDPEKLTPYARRKMRVGRNDPCPCGSGMKFKKCCRLGDSNNA